MFEGVHVIVCVNLCTSVCAHLYTTLLLWFICMSVNVCLSVSVSWYVCGCACRLEMLIHCSPRRA